MSFTIGQRIVVSKKHWIRANHYGTIREFSPRKRASWLVEFPIKWLGGGFSLDEYEGQLLWIDDDHLEAAPKPGNRGRRVVKIAA